MSDTVTVLTPPLPMAVRLQALGIEILSALASVGSNTFRVKFEAREAGHYIAVIVESPAGGVEMAISFDALVRDFHGFEERVANHIVSLWVRKHNQHNYTPSVAQIIIDPRLACR